VQLYRAFGWEPPAFIHMPLLRNLDKTKISKRKNPVSLEYYEAMGILPEALVNFLGRMGWSMPDEREKFSYADMVAHFDFGRVSLSGPIFDLDKLDWLNGLYLRELSPEALLARLRGWLLGDAALGQLLPLVHERMVRLSDFVPKTAWFFGEPALLPVETYLPKGREKAEVHALLQKLAELVDAQRTWTAPALETVCRAFCEAEGWKPKDVFSVLRLVATASSAAPPLFDTLAVIGKARMQSRLRATLAHLA
jgi:glutamyl-tRNA synthetase